MNDLTVTDHRSLVLRYNRTAIAMTDALGSFFQYRQPQTLFTSESMQTLVFMCSNSQELFHFLSLSSLFILTNIQTYVILVKTDEQHTEKQFEHLFETLF